VSILGLTADELAILRTCLRAAIERPCIPDWEFESLIGCSRADALCRVESDLEHAEHDEQLLDQLVRVCAARAAHRTARCARRRAPGRAAIVGPTTGERRVAERC
jgi:hypothetical protein